MARAAPSWGSVPAPSSSNSKSEFWLTLPRISTMLVIWLEKVERLCSMDCSSPISAKISSKIPTRLPLSAKIGRPDWAINWVKPKVLSIMVLPPVLGPVMTIAVNSLPKCTSFATAFFTRGWRTWRSWISCPSDTWGTTASVSWIKRTLARIRSKCPIIHASLAISAAWGLTLSESSWRIRIIS